MKPLLVLVVVLASLLPFGCANWSEGDLSLVRDRVETRLAAEETALASASPAEAPAIAARVSSLRLALSDLDALAETVRGERAQGDSERRAAELLGSLVPGWGAAASAFLGAGVVWLRQSRYRRSLLQIVGSLDDAKALDPDLKSAFARNSDRIRARLDLATARLIDDLRSP